MWKKFCENKFRLEGLSSQEIDELYNNFKDTYEGSTGASFSFDEFEWRARKWDFYGDIYGGVAVRPQNSGLLKLNASFGEVDPSNPSSLSKKAMMGVLNGFKELMSENQGVGIWGAMPKDMVRTLEVFSKRNNPNDCFKAVPAPLVLAFGSKLLSSVSSAKNITVIKNPLSKNFGCLEMDTPSGRMTKQLVANKSYYQWIKEQASNKSNAVVQELVSKLGSLSKLLSHLPFVGNSTPVLSESIENIYDKVLKESSLPTEYMRIKNALRTSLPEDCFNIDFSRVSKRAIIDFEEDIDEQIIKKAKRVCEMQGFEMKPLITMDPYYRGVRYSIKPIN